MPMRPLTWLKFAPVALLPLLAAYAINSGKLLRDLEGRASQVMAQSGAGWAKLSFDGRDATIQGDSPSQEAIDAAVGALAAVPGVRRVESAARVVAQPAGSSEESTP